MSKLSIDSRRLSIFVAVAEELHFSRAADRLGMTQPPVSAAIRGLEADLGVKLFQRSTRRVTLTAAGQVLLARGRALQDELMQIEEDVRRAAEGALGECAVGFFGAAMWMGIGDLIQRFGEAFPEVRLSLEELPNAELEARLLDGQLSLGFLGRITPLPESLDGTLVCEEPYWIALPADHSLAKRRKVDLRKLDHQPLLFFPRRYDPILYDAWDDTFDAYNVRPKIREEVRSIQAEIGLVAAGVGMSPGPSLRRPDALSGR